MGHVTVHQLESRCPRPRCFMNVDESDGWVSVEGTVFEKKTLLLRSGISWKIIQFESKEFMDEWMEKNEKYWSEIQELVW